MKEKRLARDVDELGRHVLLRLENLRYFIEGYKQGKIGLIKSISSELRVLVSSGGHNNSILLKLAALHDLSLVVIRDVPPVENLKSKLSLEEYLDEAVFMSAVPAPLTLTGHEIIKKYANQQGSHEDMFLSEDLMRLRADGLRIGGIPALDACLINIAQAVLQASVPLERRLRIG